MSTSRGSRVSRGGSGRGRGRYEANSKGSRTRNEGDRSDGRPTSAPSQWKGQPKPNGLRNRRSIDQSTGQRSQPKRLLASTTSKAQAWRDASIEDPTTYRKRIGDLFETLRENRIGERKDAIRNGFLADPDKPTSLAHAITPVGTCQDMCPEFERVERINQRYVDNCEKTTSLSTDARVPCEEYMVKRFRRSAAGYDEQLPSDIRPPQVLQKTLNYLIDDVIGGSPSFSIVHKFVWDRTRGIRNDFSIQQVTKVEDLRIAVDCFERIARFHILSLHQLSRPGENDGEFDHHQEREQLNNTLLSLVYYYDDSRHKLTSPNEAEFRAYCVIFEIQDQRPDLEDRAQNWPRAILKDRKVQTALRIYAAAGNTSDEQGPLRPRASFMTAQANYGLFWSLVMSNEVSYMMACVAEMYFNLVRTTALESIWKASNRRMGTTKMEEWPLSDLVNALAFDNEDQAQAFGEDHGFVIGENGDEEAYIDLTSVSGKHLTDSNPQRKQMFSKKLVEAKRLGRTLPAAINGLSATEARNRGFLEESSDTNSIRSSREGSESLFLSDNSADEAPQAKNFDGKPRSITNGNTSSIDTTTKEFGSGSTFGVPTPLIPQPTPSQNSTKASTPFIFKVSDTDTKCSTFGKPSLPATNGVAPPKFEFATPKTTATGSYGIGEDHAFNFAKLGAYEPETQSTPAVDPFVAPRGNVTPILPPLTSTIPPRPTFSFSTLGNSIFEAPLQASPKANPENTTQTTTLIGNTTPATVLATPANNITPSKSMPLPTFSFAPTTASPSTLFSFPPTTTLFPTPFTFKPTTESAPPSFAFDPPKDQPTSTLALPSPSSIAVPPPPPLPPVQEPSKPIASFPPPAIISGPNMLLFNEPTLPATSHSTSFLPSNQETAQINTQITPPITSSDHFQPKPTEATITSKSTASVSKVDTTPRIPLTDLPSSRLIANPVASGPASGDHPKPEPLPAAFNSTVHAMVFGDEGLLQQFIVYTLGPIVTSAFKQDQDEQSWERARENRRILLGKKFFRRWKSKAWDLCILRKGRERRRNFARSMQELARTSREQSQSSAHQSSSLGSSSDERNFKQQRHLAYSVMGPPIKPTAKRASLPGQLETSPNQDGASIPNPPQGMPARRHKSYHKRSNTVDISGVSGRSSVSTNSTSLSRFDAPTLSDGSYISETVMKKARRLASGRTDTTRTEYFRLKALGIDPDTSIIPKTTTKKRTRDSDGSNPNKHPRPSPPCHAPAVPSHSNTSRTNPPQNLSHLESNLSNPDAKFATTTTSDEETEALLAQMRTVRDALSESISWFQSERTKSVIGSSHSSSGRPETENERKLREWKRTPTRIEQRLRASGGKGVLGDVCRKRDERAKRDEREAAREERRVDGEQLMGFAKLANRFAVKGMVNEVEEDNDDDDVIELSD